MKEETAIQYEFGARHEGRDVARARDRLSLAVNAYYADVDDFVDSRVTFIDFDTATFAPGTGLVVGGTTRTENVDARLWGFEAEALGAIMRDISLNWKLRQWERAFHAVDQGERDRMLAALRDQRGGVMSSPSARCSAASISMTPRSS